MARTVINNGDSGLVVRNALNAMTTELYAANGMDTTNIPVLCTSGHSIGFQAAAGGWGTPLAWALARTPRKMIFDPQQKVTGNNSTVFPTGTNIAVGGANAGSTNNGNLQSANTLAALVAINPTHILCDIGVNDAGGSSSTLASNIRAYYDYAKANCPRLRGVAFWLVTPNSNITTAATARQAFEQSYMIKALENDPARPGIRILDSRAVMLDVASDFAPRGGTNGAAGNFTADGIHPGLAYGRNLQTIAMVDNLLDGWGILRQQPRMVSRADYYDATNSPDGSILENTGGVSNGTFAGTAGTLAGTGATGSVASAWAAATLDETTNTLAASDITATFSKVTITDGLGRTGVSAQRIVVGGTAPTNVRYIRLRRLVSNLANVAVSATKFYEAQIMCRISGATGAYGPYLDALAAQNNGSTRWYFGQGSNYRVPALQWDGLTEDLVLRLPAVQFTTASQGAMFFDFIIPYASGVVPAGTIDIWDAGMWPIS